MKKLLLVFLSIAYVGAMQAQKATEVKSSKSTVVDTHAGHDHSHEAGPEKTEAAPVVTNPNAAKIIFAEEAYNFKEVPEGPQVTHEFKFSNKGKEPLILSNVRASCGCTTPSWPKEPVLPGKEATILVTYNTQGRPGPFTKTITVTSNADNPNAVITIKGEVIKEDPAKSVPMETPSMLAPK